MNIKKLVILDGVKIAVKFNPLDMVLIIGGHQRSFTKIKKTLNCFEVESYLITKSNSKCRCIITNCRRSIFENGIVILSEKASISDVNEFGRIMR